MIIPECGANDSHECECGVGVLCHDFRGKIAKEVKKCTCKTSSDVPHWQIMARGISPVGQSLGKLVNKLFKGYFRDMLEKCSLTARINSTTGRPKAP